VVRRLNAYVEETKPWELAKDDDVDPSKLDGVLFDLADGLRCVAVALSPFVPGTAATILEELGQPADVSWSNVAAGKTVAVDGIEPAAPLFPRVDAPAAA